MFGSLLKNKDREQLVSVDIGTSSIEIMELDISGSRPKLISAALSPTPGGCITNNQIVKPDQVAQAIRALLDSNEIKSQQAVFALPGPTVFSKKVMLAMSKAQELANNIVFEATNYIPHKIENVHLDYQVLRTINNQSMEVLLVAVKNEIMASYLETLTLAGLVPAIADVDFFALETMFELNYPEELKKTVALINIGSRYSSVNIYQDGQSLFTGDIGVGGRLYTDALCETANVEPKVAERMKMGEIPESVDPNLVRETLDRTTEHVASELHRQIGFFWNAAATDRSIETVFLSGGGALSPGLLEELSAKTGLKCELVDPFRNVDVSGGFDRDYLGEISSQMAISVGLAQRRFGDKKQAID